jgi:sterol desaturase/sphingolipid hydroxylase (fatty acid hydroxylase superfamily)
MTWTVLQTNVCISLPELTGASVGFEMLAETANYIGGFISVFLGWTLITYWLHRLSHYQKSWNFLYKVHQTHHKVNYFVQYKDTLQKKRLPLIYYTFIIQIFDIHCLNSILITTVPAIAFAIAWPKFGIPLLCLHYLYEVFCQDQLAHNPRIRNVFLNHFFATGPFHMEHHLNAKTNFGIMNACWDYVFRTSKKPNYELQKKLDSEFQLGMSVYSFKVPDKTKSA